MFLNRNNIEKIKAVLNQFPDVDSFELDSDSTSGIGSVLVMTFAQEVNGVRGSFDIEISGVEDW